MQLASGSRRGFIVHSQNSFDESGSRRVKPQLSLAVPGATCALCVPRMRTGCTSGLYPADRLSACQKCRPPSQAIPGPPTIGGSPSGQTLELRRGAPHRGSGIPILYVAAAPLTQACIYLSLSNQYQNLMPAGKINKALKDLFGKTKSL